MATDDRKKLLKELQHRSITEALESLPYITEVFRRKDFGYDLNKVITNELDFLLGAVFSHILNIYAIHCLNRGIRTSQTEAHEFNLLLFSNASKFRDAIRELIGL